MTIARVYQISTQLKTWLNNNGGHYNRIDNRCIIINNNYSVVGKIGIDYEIKIVYTKTSPQKTVAIIDSNTGNIDVSNIDIKD